MIEEIKEVVNLGGQVVIVVLFLGYLVKKDNLDKLKDEKINLMINNHLHTSGKIIDKNSKALNRNSYSLEKLSAIIGKNTKSQDMVNRG